MYTSYINFGNSFHKIFDPKMKEYQEAQKVKKDKEIKELVERYMYMYTCVCDNVMCTMCVIPVACFAN